MDKEEMQKLETLKMMEHMFRESGNPVTITLTDDGDTVEVVDERGAGNSTRINIRMDSPIAMILDVTPRICKLVM
nr:MAG TPA: Phosphoglucomutase/phosphomannomutase [Caudoviricetes sp.]